jgi:hypothetical protein
MDVYIESDMVELFCLFAGYLSTVKKDTKEDKNPHYPLNTQLQYLSNIKNVFSQHTTCKTWALWRQHDDTEGWYKNSEMILKKITTGELLQMARA